MKPIRVLIADDSELFAEFLSSLVSDEPDMEVVAVAENGERAVKLCSELKPDIILMDIQMPRMDGLIATQYIMSDTPTPILVITSDPYHGGVDMSFKALSAGALDLIAKPEFHSWAEPSRREFIRKIRLLSQVTVVRHMRGRRQRVISLHGRREVPDGKSAIIGIVASTGGPRGLAKFVADLPPGFPAPVLIVQHIIQGFSTHLATWLNKNSELLVLEAEDGMPIKAGQAYIAPADRHLEVTSKHTLKLYDAPPVVGHCPSGDVLLESLAKYHGERAIGIVMSGMGSDGTAGLAAIHHVGGHTMVQDRASCVVYSMPQSAIDLDVVQEVVKLEDMARATLKAVETIHRGIEE